MKNNINTGDVFGRLTVLGRTDYLQNGRRLCICQCECGNIKDILPYSLTSGKTKSCGCLQKEIASKIGSVTGKVNSGKFKIINIIGKKYGKLTVIELTQKNPVKWKCLCECGTITYVSTHDLNSGNTTSCGCVISKGEFKIKELLNLHKISFVSQKTFDTCKYPNSNGIARFDFFVNNEYIIEYDGKQHFEEIEYFQLSLKEQQERDLFKNEWCYKNNIPIIRIPYTHLNNLNINDLLLDTSDFLINKQNKKF